MVTFFKNGDALFSGMKVSLTFATMGALNDYLTARANIPNGARYIFSLDGRRITRLEQLEHDALYVVSGSRNFENLPYGQQKLGDWQRNHIKEKTSGLRSADLSLIRPLPKTVQRLPNGKGTFGNTSGGSSSSMAGPGSRDGRIIQIVNNADHSVSSRVLLNMKTTQMFPEVLEDLGHVLRIREGTIKMYTMWGAEVQSFSQLRNEFKETDTFYLCTGESHSKAEKKSAVSDPGFYTIDATVGGPVNYRHEFGKTKEEPVNPFQPVRATMNGVNGMRKEITKRYGYQGQRGTNNLIVLPTGEMVYFVAAVVVLYHRHHNAQRHYLGHTEDVQCMALHPFSEVIATGQKSGKTQVTLSHVRIWDPENLSTHAIIGLNEFENGIESLCFGDNTDGAFLAVVDSSEDHVLSVWNWRDEVANGRASLDMRSTLQTQRDTLSGVVFHPGEENLLITYGKQHLCIWKRHKDGIFDRNDIIKSVS
ncbi:Echinoderm microtubule-associated protein-like [Nymphon striatum]|nr:Echinoderm microtubule-associated protein-like [Nymphon striatum]